MKILITGGFSATSFKLLKSFEKDEILLADYGAMPLIKPANYTFITLGERNEDIAAHNLLNISLDHEVEAILPLQKFEIVAVAKASQLFKEYGITVLLPEISLLVDFMSSSILHENVIRIYRSSSESESAYAEPVHLGAFYLNENNEPVKLVMI